MRRGLVLAALAVALAGSGLGRAAPPPERIVFAANRAPLVSGEVYRLDAAGRRVDLSRSPFQDTGPVVSPDGRHVAFLSDRSGAISVYEVGIDGRGLRRIGPSLPLQGQQPALAWQPHGNRLALLGSTATNMTLWLLQAGRKPQAVLHAGGLLDLAWSGDGRVVTAAAYPARRVDAFDPSGRALWSVGSLTYGTSWSASLFAANSPGSGIAVYDERGRLRFEAPGRSALWSPDGTRLALIAGRSLVVRSASGTVVLRKSLPLGPQSRNGVVWAGPERVVVGGVGRYGAGRVAVDLRTGTTWPASGRWFAARSADGALAVETSPRAATGGTFAVRVLPVTGGAATVYGHVPGCFDDGGPFPAVDSLQFAGRSLVYASRCAEPLDNLYSVAPDGSGLRRITSVQAEEATPALSPDGGRIAYAWSRYTGLSCKGCPSSIRLLNADGSAARTLTNPTGLHFDVTPTWSPDGTQLLFSRSSANRAPELYTIPAAGGPARDLHVAGADPAWGPSRIAYVTPFSTPSGLWTANPDGSDPRQVAAGGARSPAWSADGRLAYLAGRAGTTAVVGSATVHLPFAWVASLAWSPDGTRLVVAARTTRSAPLDVFAVRPDGTGVARLTRNLDASSAGRR